MKKLLTVLLVILMTSSVFLPRQGIAQTPEKMSFQAVIRNSSEALVTNKQIGIQISILQGSASGTAVYAETQTPTTNANGLVSLEIGAGTVVSGTFATIDWSAGPYFIKTETDLAGGTSYTITGTSQLLSVPYALHAKTAETITGSIIETDPIFTNSPAAKITETHLANLENPLYRRKPEPDSKNSGPVKIETDPIYSASQSANITTDDISNLRKLSGTNTGDQDISGIAVNAAAISDEATRALAAEDVLTTAIVDEAITARAAESANADAIATETTRATTAEGLNVTAISDEAITARAAESANADAITAEETARIAGDNANAAAANAYSDAADAIQSTALNTAISVAQSAAQIFATDADIAQTIVLQEYADQAESDAIATGAADATTRVLVETNRATAAEAANAGAISTHAAKTDNPHAVTKTQVGLENVDNTSDASKPVSALTQTALNGKVDDAQVLTNVPLNALFTDTQLDAAGVTALGFTIGPHTVNTDTQLTEAEVDDFVSDNGYLTTHQDLSSYATKDMANATITNLATPVNDKDAATKAYVDLLAAKLAALEPRITDLELTSKVNKISGFVWFDYNSNGIQDQNEPDGIQRVFVKLTYPDESFDFQITDDNGNYMFNNLPAGTYSVEVTNNGVPTNYVATTSTTIVVPLDIDESYSAYFGFK
jgi:hypothetical protein